MQTIQNDLSSAIHWPIIENTQHFVERTEHSHKWRQNSSERVRERCGYRRNEMRIERKLKREPILHSFILTRCCAPFAQHTAICRTRLGCVPRNWRKQKNWEEIVKQHAVRLLRHCVVLLLHCAHEESTFQFQQAYVWAAGFALVSLTAFYHRIFSIIRNVAPNRCSYELVYSAFFPYFERIARYKIYLL